MQLITTTPDWLTPVDLNLIRRAFKYGQTKLGLASRSEAIHLRFDPLLSIKEGIGGEVINGSRDPILMRIGRAALFNMISCFFHELTHVKQIVNGELAISPEAEFARFRGKYFYQHDIPEAVKTEADWNRYLNLPWEVEARAQQEKLMLSFGTTLSIPEALYVADRRP